MYHVSTGKTMLTDSKRFETNTFLNLQRNFHTFLTLPLFLLFHTAGSGQRKPPDLCFKWGDFNFAGSHAWKAEVPPTSSSSLRGSRWPDLAVTTTNSPPLTQDSEYLLRFLRSLPFLLKTTQKYWARPKRRSSSI